MYLFSMATTGIPCSHIIGAILASQENPQTYIQVFLSLNPYHRMYDNAILPPNANAMDQPLQYYYDTSQTAATDNGNDGKRPRVIALHVRHQIGRPRKTRIRSGAEGPFGSKHLKKCGCCEGLGHTQNTCTREISGS